MFKNGRKTDVPQNGEMSSDKGGKGAWIKENKRSIIAVGLIVIMAFIMRFIFAVGVSAGSEFALSGGTVASEHLHTITQILSGGSFFGVDDTLNYPFGSVNSNPVLIDCILAGIASIGTSLGMLPVKAASLTLSTFSLMCGTFAVIPMFLLGKEVVGTRKAGFVAALFLAFCPIVISQTVFSNGTETGWILLLFIVLSLLIFKGIKAVNFSAKTEDPMKETIAANRSALKLAVFAGLVLALIALSTNAFRPIVELLIFSMAIMTVVGRFMYRDTRPAVLFFSIIIAIGMAVATAYYIPAQLWDQVLSGILVASVAAIALCFTFSMLQTKPWVVTIPAYIIGVVVVLVLLSFFAPDFYEDLVNGNTIFADCIASLTGGSLSISYLSTAFGVVAMWFGLFVIGVIIWKLPKNISSLRYQFLAIFMVFSAYMTFQSEKMAVIFSPVFALGFAYIVMWLFDHVDFKTYFLTIKNAGWKGAWKKVLKPIPFATILIIAVLLCVPIGMYAVDASISNNSTDDYEGLDLGAIGYYVKTDDDWKTGPVLTSYYFVEKDGALVTWIDSANDAAAKGRFNVIVDAEGNGAEAVSNILLSNAVDGSSDASMLIYMLMYTGMTDEVKTALDMGDEKFDALKEIMDDPSKFRETVVTDTEKYGILESDVSDDNIRFIYGAEYLTDNFSAYKISSMYSAVAGVAGKNISYFMVDGNMFPMYYGYSSSFSTMGYANGYAISDNYGTVTQFLKAGTYTYYTGIYEYTDAMFDTLLWRSYIGMSPSEAGFSAAYQYLEKLILSDGTYKVHPGYGLSNYTVDYSHWYVMYNPDSDATVTSDGWEKMTYKSAVAKQNSEGGLINYLSGLPVFMKYVPNTTGNAVSGHIASTAAANVSGIRVSVEDSEGTVRSTAFTDDNGDYTILVTGNNSKIKYYSGSQNLTDGNLIKTVDYSAVVGGVQNINITLTSVTDGKFVDADDNAVDMTGKVMKLEGKVSKEVYTPAITAAGFTVADMVPDVYTVTLTSADGKVSYVTEKTITVNQGNNQGVIVELDSQKVTITVNDDSKTPLAAVNVNVVDVSTGANVNSTPIATNADGEIKINLLSGSYICSFTGDYVSSSSPFTVTSDTSSATVTAHATTDVDFAFGAGNEYKMVTIYSTGYQTTALTDGTGNVTVKLPTGTGAGAVYTAYLFNGTQGYFVTSDAPGTIVPATFKVTGTMKDSSDEVTSGTILFIIGAAQIPVSVASDGTYSVYLAAGDYTVYANHGTQVSISRITVSAEMTNDITLGSGKQVSGSTTWGSNSYGMPFVPVDVSNITGCDGCAFTVTTDDSGSYSFYIPEDSSCDLNARLLNPGNYYYGSSDAKDYTKSVTGQTGSVSAIKANVDGVEITNNFGYKIMVDSTTIENGGHETVPITGGSWTVEVYDESSPMYSKKTIYNRPGMAAQTIEATFFDGETKYYVCTVTDLQDGETVSVKPVKDGSVGKTYTSSHKYYLEYVDGDPQDYMFTITNADSSKIMYMIVTEYGASSTFAASTSDAATVKGYIGYNGSGTMTLTYDDSPAVHYEFSISSGKYSILVPINRAMTLEASVKDESASVTYTYTGTVNIAASTLAAGSTNVYNMAVTSAEGPGTDEMTATMVVNSMSSGGMSTVNFTVVLTKPASGDMTYSLYGGSGWSNVRFYSDSARTVEISTTTFDTTATIYGKGTIIRSNIAYAADDLSVIVKDVNGETVCTATITGGENAWSRTTPAAETTKVNITDNSLGDSEYMYAVEIVNNDNFTKKFTLVPTGIDTDKWFVTYVNGKVINGSVPGVIEVKGYTTATVFVKITYKSGDEAPALPENISVAITVTDLSDVAISAISTDTPDSVTIAGNVATANSTTTNSVITVDESGATGRDVVDKKSDMPVYVWLLIALAVAGLFFIIWAASKRGVFARKK